MSSAVVTAVPEVATWPALGTTVSVAVVDPGHLETARRVVDGIVEDLDATCSRFRPDAEIAGLAGARGRPREVSPMLFEAISAAVRAARMSGGAVDPTGGARIRILGYDRDFSRLERPDGDSRTGDPVELAAFPGWNRIGLDPEASTVCVPVGVELDLGSTAKGWAADRAAQAASAATGGASVLVSLGGDIAVAGPPPDNGWAVRLADDSAVDPSEAGPQVLLGHGGLATSGTTVRRWVADGVTRHHILDPRTGGCADGPWRTVTVAAASCFEANVAATAAIVEGSKAQGWLERRGLPARLVGHDDSIVRTCGWPPDEAEVLG